MKTTQHQLILDKLDDLGWHCSNELRNLYVPEFRSRISELRHKGYKITAERCKLHDHKGNMQMWRLEGEPQKTNIYTPLEQERNDKIDQWIASFKPKENKQMSLL